MCEIFAVSSRKAQRYDRYLSEFFSDAVKHPHGWGLCWHEGPDMELTRLFKEPVTAVESAYLDYLLNMGVESKLLIAHIRNATRGIVSYGNTHPFIANDSSGRQWVLCHNGTVFDNRLLEAFEEVQLGTTDSERIMLYLIDAIDRAQAECGSSLDETTRFELLSQQMERLSPDNKLNLAFDDGEFLYIHTNTEQPTLYVRETVDKVLVCSRPLGEGWHEVERGRLIVYRDGERVYASPAHSCLFDNDAYLQLVATWTAEDQQLGQQLSQ
ncbi:MAG: class II glutamine amidotransferase [Atopobiaceae bacterium]|nr:class II glutamine amidotransferase [Atopobiaceae bacterium]